MTDACFMFDVDSDLSLVRITICGFLEAADVHRYALARDEAHRKLRCRPNQHLTMVDLRGMSIQKQEVVAELSKLLSDPRRTSERMAFVVSGALARMQLRRMVKGRNVSFFASTDTAEAWLLGTEAPLPDSSTVPTR